MTAGLPGVGIGGMFYLISALLMPFRSMLDAVRGRESRWPLALRQAFIALGALGAVWATGWGVGWLMTSLSPAPVAGAVPDVEARNAVRTVALLGSICTLTIVLAVVQVMRLVLPPRFTPRAAPAESARKTQSAA